MKGEVIGEAALVMAPEDTVATALEELQQGTELPVDGAGRADAATVAVAESVPFGHKVALVPTAAGEEIYKYGEVIGRATEDVAPGQWVHTHNCESTRGRGDLAAAGAESGGSGGARPDGTDPVEGADQ